MGEFRVHGESDKMRRGCKSVRLYFIIGTLGVFFIPNLPPYNVDFRETTLKEVPLTGGMTPNRKLEESLELLSSRVNGAQFGEIKARGFFFL